MALSQRTSNTIGRVAAFLLGMIFLVAAWAKMLDPAAFAEQIAAEGLDIVFSAHLMAILAIGLEVGLGVALVLGLRGRLVLVPTGLLIVLFLILTGKAYWLWSQGLLDQDAACGCFGNLVERTPAEAFWQDLLMMVPLYLMSWMGGRGLAEGGVSPGVASGDGRWKWIVAVIATVGAMLFAWRAPALPLDDLATKLKPGSRIEEMCAGGEDDAESICLDVLLPRLSMGEHWVVLSELENETLQEGVEALNELALSDMEKGVWVLSADPLEIHQAFFWQAGPVFEVKEVPLALIRPMYRATPRSFRLEDGIVAETRSGLPTGPEPQ